MNINGVGSSMMYGSMQSMQKPSASEMAENLFSSIDSNDKGYIEQADLESAMSNLGDSDGMMSSDEMFALLDSDSDGKVTQQELTSSFEDMAAEMNVRMRGDMPPPPPPGGMDETPSYSQEELADLAESTEDSTMASLFSDLTENFDEADANGDGVVSAQEAMSFQQGDEESSQTMNGNMPPPPPPGGMGEAPSYSQEELADLAESTEDSTMASLFSELAESFEDADANGDGVVSAEEAMQYQGEESATATNAQVQSVDAQLMRTMTELMRTYSGDESSSSSFSASA